MPPHKASRKPTHIHVPKSGAVAKIAKRDGLNTITLLWSLLQEEIRQRPGLTGNPSYQTAADQLDLTPSAVQSRYFRLRNAFAKDQETAKDEEAAQAQGKGSSKEPGSKKQSGGAQGEKNVQPKEDDSVV